MFCDGEGAQVNTWAPAQVFHVCGLADKEVTITCETMLIIVMQSCNQVKGQLTCARSPRLL
jgi:hypothetical protein